MTQQFEALPHWKQKSQIRGEMIAAWLNGSASSEEIYFFIELAKSNTEIPSVITEALEAEK